MIQERKTIITIALIILVSINIFTINTTGCKDIVAVGDATENDYNLLLKVRDPSRPGLQVLCIIPEGYSYSYRHPWTGKKIDFKVEHKFIGVATIGDTIPNIVKAGMALSEAGIAYGDADTNSNWKNPTKNSWDDFDWIRYACEKAQDEDEAVRLLTEDLVDDMHASGVSENLFVVGPNKAYVVEADAFHYDIREIEDIEVMSNYPKTLWKTQRHKKFLISSSFDIKKEQYIKKGRTIRLNSFYGVKIVDIGDNFIIARQVPFLKINKIPIFVGRKEKIGLNESGIVGDFYVKLLDIDGRKAKISVSNKYKAWEEKMLEHITPCYGEINLKDMFNWSRLTSEDLGGLRPMCEEIYPYEAVMIYKIPNENYKILSSGWFSSNHASSSIYVPVHICNNEIYEPYKNGKAAELSLNLLETYGNDYLKPYLNNVEDVFLYEIQTMEDISLNFLSKNVDISDFITINDLGVQKQAMLTQEIWFDIKNSDLDLVKDIWNENYFKSLEMMKNKIEGLKNISGSSAIIENIKKIALNICETRMDAVESVGFDILKIKEKIDIGKRFLDKNQYKIGFDSLQIAYNQSNSLLFENNHLSDNIGIIKKDDSNNLNYYILIFFVIICIIIIAFYYRKKSLKN